MTFPGNLLGYNLYKNDVLLGYLAHSGDDEPQFYIDSNNMPGFYDYEVSGIYDLEPYGFPGDTGESMRVGTDLLVLDYCVPLVFNENWDSGNFTENNWQTEGSGWQISEGSGYPEPCACFQPDSALVNYTAALVSYPFCGQLLSEGEVWLDFDLSLNSIQSTGNEKLKVEIWNWIMNDWKTVKEFSNLTGNIDWTREYINIGRFSLEKIFSLKFVAVGSNSADIGSWCIDNIEIYRVCPAPDSLTAEVLPQYSSIALNWSEPRVDHIDQWIFWGDGNASNNSIGTGDSVEFDVAQRWEPAQLMEYYGGSVTEVEFFPMETNCDYLLRIWTGPNAENLVCQEPVDAVIGQWNTVFLPYPLIIETNQELWIGYNVNTSTGYPAGVDNGPALNGYGNMMYFGGAWQTLLEVNPGLDYNFSIRAHVQTLDDKETILTSSQPFNTSTDKTKSLSGYNIYRKSGNDSDFELIGFAPENEYLDNDLLNEMYCYRVSAVWSGEADTCESQWTDEACEIMNVSVPLFSDKELNIKIYPNPSTGWFTLSSSVIIRQVIIFDEYGNRISDYFPDSQNYTVKHCFPAGFYFIRIISDKGTWQQKLVVL
jgi:hypothetical protein